jgi:hypothetical protein
MPFSGFHQCNIVTLRSKNLPQYQFARHTSGRAVVGGSGAGGSDGVVAMGMMAVESE